MNAGKLRVWALFLVLNLFGTALLAITYMQGWVDMVVERDTSYICITIFGMFLIGLGLCYQRVVQINRSFDELAAGGDEGLNRYRKIAKVNPGGALESLRLMLGRKLSWINSILYLLPALGLLGTVVGITMGLEGSVVANASNVKEIVEKLFFQVIAGLSVAFYTTIVGMIFMLWLYFNLKILEIESIRLMETILDSANNDSLEAHERAQLASAANSPAPSTETSTEPSSSSPPVSDTEGV